MASFQAIIIRGIISFNTKVTFNIVDGKFDPVEISLKPMLTKAAIVLLNGAYFLYCMGATKFKMVSLSTQ